jgi:hypothetical protein
MGENFASEAPVILSVFAPDHADPARKQPRAGRADAKTLSFFGASGPDPLTLANSPLCSGSTRPGIETRYLE